MKFCPECESVMTKAISSTGGIVFHCRCELPSEGGPDDTLMAEGFLEASESNLKHEVFIENSPFDPAANIIFKDCPNCGLNFMVMIRIGSGETTIYTCSCGYRITHEGYLKEFEAKASNKNRKGKEQLEAKNE